MRTLPLLFLLLFSLSPILASASTVDQVKRLDSSVVTLIQALERFEEQAPEDPHETLQQVRRQRQEALAMAADGDQQAAATRLREALTDLKIRINHLRGNGHISGDAQSPDYLREKQQGELDNIGASVESLLTALIAIGEEKGRQVLTDEIGAQVKLHQEAAAALAERGALVPARQELDQALVTVKTAIAALRNHETLIRSLDFASKEEEYIYEKDRQETYRMLLQLLVEKKSLAEDVRLQIDTFQRDAQVERERAEAAANTGDFEAGVNFLELSNNSLLKAIRRGGIYVPGG